MILQNNVATLGDTTEDKPVPEHVHGDFLPYRGQDVHGVAETAKPVGVPGNDGTIAVVYEDPEPEPEPIPVRVVNQRGRELRLHRPIVVPLPANGAVQQVIGRHEARSSIRIKNTGTVVAYLLTGMSGAIMTGYPMAVNETMDLSSQGAVYMCNDGSATAGAVAILEQYSVEL